MASRKKHVVDPRQADLFAPQPVVPASTPPPAPRASTLRPAPSAARPPPVDADLFTATVARTEPVPVAAAAVAPSIDDVTRQRFEAMQLNRNAAFMAGAGAGKTHSLITMCLHALAGARVDPKPVAPRELWLMTFSDQAANEMWDRLRKRIDGLASGQHEKEIELTWSFAELGRPMPDVVFWRDVRENLGTATIKTFHAVCMQILKDAPAAEPLELLEDRASQPLLNQLATRAVLDALEAKSAGLVTLMRSQRLDYIVDSLIQALKRIREEGVLPQTLALSSEEDARADAEAALRRSRQALSSALSTGDQSKPAYATLVKLRPLLEGLTLENFQTEWHRIDKAIEGARATGMLEDVLYSLRGKEKDREDSLVAALCTWQMIPTERAIRALLVTIAERYDTALRDRRQIDFTGQLVRCRDLLRDNPHHRHAVQQRIRVLLTDEFQDTNRLQMEILSLLAEERSGAPRQLSASLEGPSEELTQLPLQPGLLAIVGDLKQSIYEFRGADVGVFRQTSETIVQQGGVRIPLTESRRSSARLVKALNAVMHEVMSPVHFDQPLLPFQVAFGQEDSLSAHRSLSPAGAPVIQLKLPALEGATVEDNAVNDARAIARYLAWAFATNSLTVVDKATGLERPARPVDVALLFRSTKHLAHYRQALLNEGIRHRLSMKRGFATAAEVGDLASLLQILADSTDAISMAAVLRSPLVGLSDDSLTTLALAAPQGLAFDSVRAIDLTRLELPAEEFEALSRCLEVISQLKTIADRASISEVLQSCYIRLDVRERYAGVPFAEQALGNLDKLLELADAAGTDSLASFAGRLLNDVDGEIDDTAEAEVTDTSSEDVVTISTVHAAKGLEWPVVILASLFSGGVNSGALIRFERSQGLAVSFTSEVFTKDAKSRRFEAVKSLQQRRADAETRRLIYVAATRARDRLILGGIPEKQLKHSWGEILTTAIGAAAITTHDEFQEVDAEPLRWTSEEPPASSPDAAEVERLIERIENPRPLTVEHVMLPVTQLQEFENCPRRFHFGAQLGLPETPVEIDWVDHEERPSNGDPRERGVMAHRLLELTPLETTEGAPLMAALQAIRRVEGFGADAEVDDWVSAFWKSEFGKRVAAAGPAVKREASFVLKLKGASALTLLLRGQIDLLFEENGHAYLIDYKTTHSTTAGVTPYAFQLSCYALAARHLVPEGMQLHAGIVFLKDADPFPHFLKSIEPEQLLTERLTTQAQAMMQAQAAHDWPRRSIEKCRALHCGYISRCYPEKAAL